MKARGSIITKRFLLMMIIAVTMVAATNLSAMAETKAQIEEGTYYLKAVNGNAKGQVLYWNEDISDQNICMMFESSGGKHADNEIWYVTKNRNYDDYYGIYLYRKYTGNKDKSPRIEIDNLTGRDEPALITTTGPHVFCGPYGNQDDAFQFFCQDSTPSYTNLIIESHDDKYRFFRHKDVKLFKSDLIYVKANTKHDTSDKLWELIPVNYTRKLSSAAPTVSSNKSGEVKINWDKLRNKIKNTKVWKKAKYIEIQYSTDKEFLKNVKTKKIKKGTVNKAKAKSKLSKLKRKKTYYVRARLLDKKGVASNWSKAVIIKAKK